MGGEDQVKMRIRRGLQFSLSTLLFIVAALGIGLGVRVRQADRQRQAIQAIHKLGGAVLYQTAESKKLPPATHSRFERYLGAVFIEPVEYVSFRTSRPLSLHPELIQTGLAELKHLHGLRTLRLEGLEVSDADLEQLEMLKSLRLLDLSWTNVSETGIARIERALPECRVVR